MRSAAGGEPAHPALHGGRGLKQRRNGLFWDSRRNAGFTEEACPSCRACGTGSLPHPDQGNIAVMHGARHAGRTHHRRFTRRRTPPCRRGSTVEMTARIREFLKQRRDEGPCLVLDLDVVRENYLLFAKALPDTRVFYAVKANPAPEVLKLLAELGSCFDVASVSETEAVLAAGATPERISYGNTIKKESEIAAV